MADFVEVKHAPRVQTRARKPGRSRNPLALLRQETEAVRLRSYRLPSALKEEPTYVRRFRFRFNSAGLATVTADCICNLFGVATGSTSAKRLFQAVRLLKIEYWVAATAASSGESRAGYLTVFSNNPNTGHSAPTNTFDVVSTDKPGYLGLRPGVLTDQSRWLDTSLSNTWILFNVYSSQNDEVELTVEYNVSNPTTQGTPSSIVGTGLIAGRIYQTQHLDGTSTSGTAGSGLLDNIGGWALGILNG